MADNFTVVSQADTRMPGPTGTYVDAVLVTFETKPSGITGTVAIPVIDFQPDRVGPLITRLAADREAVQAL